MRPDDTVDSADVRTHFLVQEMVAPFTEEVDVMLRKRWKKTIRIKKLANLAVEALNPKPIFEDFVAVFYNAFKETVFGQALQLITGTLCIGNINQLTTFGIIHIGAHDQTIDLTFYVWVHTQNSVRLYGLHTGDGLDGFVTYFHKIQ